jgi:hypothetical protein
MLYILPATHPQSHLRHRCRNPKCGLKLKTPVENPRDAFCCKGCFVGFYRKRCLVCEDKLPPGPENREICRRSKCRAEVRKFPHLYRRSKYGERPLGSDGHQKCHQNRSSPHGAERPNPAA